MEKKWTLPKLAIKALLLMCLVSACSGRKCDTSLDNGLKKYVDNVLGILESLTRYVPGVVIEKTTNKKLKETSCSDADNLEDVENYTREKFGEFIQSHAISLNFSENARSLQGTPRNSFLTGFGMGFLAFALKKLLLPVFIGAQLIKSMLIAMFLPSLLGTFGKFLGKGLSTFSGISGASAGINNHQQPMEDFEFKDTEPYNNENVQDLGVEDTGLTLNVASSTSAPDSTNSRLSYGHNRVSYLPNDNYYVRKPNKKTDFKVFHKIPPSSVLLTSYDPFYSPLLSRLDTVFQQLGLGNEKSPEIEKCRERLVCLMYANPAKYAPYSNLVSAQLSRELNELKKPSSDNSDILRFFRYMKAAKDGQDGEECKAHGGCPYLSNVQASPAILTTYNEINKLVQARKFVH